MTKLLRMNPSGNIEEFDVNNGLNDTIQSGYTFGEPTGQSQQGLLKVNSDGILLETADGFGDVGQTYIKILSSRTYTYWLPRNLPPSGSELALQGNKALISRSNGTDTECFFELATPQRPFFDTTNRPFSNVIISNVVYDFRSPLELTETANYNGIKSSVVEFKITGNVIKSGIINDTVIIDYIVGLTTIASQSVSLSTSIYTGNGRGFELTGTVVKQSIDSGYFVQANMAVSGIHDGISNFQNVDTNVSLPMETLTIRIRTNSASSVGNVKFCLFKQTY